VVAGTSYTLRSLARWRRDLDAEACAHEAALKYQRRFVDEVPGAREPVRRAEA